ncbi:MAG: hypothetical protein IJZ39_08310 [Oscillospiraceae bacterium]|nr:hypothetical protein [Oscillospiraceae bacterium]
MLAVVGIIVALIAIAIPSVIAISNALRFAQANNYAKSIFLAAQQNLTEMRSDGGLAPLQGVSSDERLIDSGHCGFPDEDWSDEYVYTASRLNDLTSYNLVLPVNSVEATIRDQQVIIEYNPITGNVYSVFYCDKAEENILSDYIDDKLPRDKGDRKKRMIGYYAGSGLSSSELEVEHAASSIEFTNGEEGIVTVKIAMPDLYIGSYSEFAKGLSVKLTIASAMTDGSAGTFQVQIKEAGEDGGNCALDTDGRTVLITYALDSLADKRSFANLSAGIADLGAEAVALDNSLTPAALTTLTDVSKFAILPGENISIEADIDFEAEAGRPAVTVDKANLDGVNPMFEYLEEIAPGEFVLAVSNGRNLQNLNAIAPSVADLVDTVIFTDDIYWNKTVDYYNGKYKGAEESYANSADEAPARALPYFVPIHNENLFGTAKFIYMDGSYDELSLLEQILSALIGSNYQRSERVPTLTDELDSQKNANGEEIATTHAIIDGGDHKVFFLNVDSTRYQVPANGKFYATGTYQVIDYYFTGLFGYVNTTVSNLHVVNPIIKGHDFADVVTTNTSTYTDPATGALIGAGGYNTLVTNCSVYLDTKIQGFNWSYADHGSHQAQTDYSKTADQTWYGVSGQGAVGGLVGYAKSHRTTNGVIDGDLAHLAFADCFAAVPVSGTMRGIVTDYDNNSSPDKDFGYSNGVGGFIGNSQLTNFYKCYASGNVRVSNTYAKSSGSSDDITTYLGLGGNGRLSMGGGGFVGTSHGTRYTNCFASGSVKNITDTTATGGFVGMMCYDETKAYGHQASGTSSEKVAQRTVFENCYSIGMCLDSSGYFLENFSGTNGKIDVNYGTLKAYYSADYYRLYAPYQVMEGKDPKYQTYYIFKDSYYLSQYSNNKKVKQHSSNKCANPIGYSDLIDLHVKYDTATWISNEDPEGQIELLKNYNLDASVIEAVYGMVRDLISDYFKNGSSLSDILNDLKLIYEIIDNARSTYQFYFDLYEFMQERGIRSKDKTLEDLYFSRYAEGFPSDVWHNATEGSTHYYGEVTTGMVYPFPKLNSMDYYGTWQEPPLAGGLAYYETYQSGTTKTDGYYFDRAETSNLNSDDDTVIVADGYAVFSGTKDDTIYVYAENGTTPLAGPLEPEPNGITLTSATSPDDSSYYVTKLPTLTVGAGNSGKSYYGAIKIVVVLGDKSEEFWALYNPNTAISQINKVEVNSGAVSYPANPDTILIRTARQFASMNAASVKNVWGKDYTFIQQLNLDASTYNWGTGKTAPVVNGIGTDEAPFNATYTSIGGYVEKPAIIGLPTTSGYFGNIGSDGLISTLNIQLDGGEDGITIGTEETKYAGLLAAVSSGSIEDVDILLDGKITVNAVNGAGLLAGKVSGVKVTDTATGEETTSAVITDCDIGLVLDKTGASNGDVAVNASNAGTGVGELLGASVSNCSMTFVNPITTTATNFGGFAGQAENLTADMIPAMFKGLTAEAANAGGFAGSLKGGKVTNLTLFLEGDFENTVDEESTVEDTVIAGAAAVVDSTELQNVNVNLKGSMTADSAAGVFGKASNAVVDNSGITVTGGSINGTTAAAGMALDINVGSFSSTSVSLQDAAITADDTSGRAAGYAVTVSGTVKNGSVVMGGYTYNKKLDTNNKLVNVSFAGPTCAAQISGGADAAGFACEISNDITDSKVAGMGTITSAGNAAGFAATISDKGILISGNGVTPALVNTSADYRYNSNDNLTITGANAAGFAVNVGQNVSLNNCYALGKIVGVSNGTTAPVIAGFAVNNAGTINGASANVTIDGGSAFIAGNSGTVVNSYGWYGNGSTSTTDNVTTAEISNSGAGKVTSAYFVDLDVPVDDTCTSAVLYNADGVMNQTSPVNLTMDALNGKNGTRWFAGGVYDAYSYSKMSTGYVYPMLRAHYGNWANPPQYAFGVAYYEQYQDGTWKIMVHDLSDPSQTVEKKQVSSSDEFNEEGIIKDAGYALFYKAVSAPVKVTGATIGDVLPILTTSLNSDIVYSFHKLVPTQSTVTVTEILVNPEPGDAATSVTIGADYALEFGSVNTHVIRTEDQLAKVTNSGSYSQTHDITLTKNFATIKNFAGTYAGNDYALNASAAANGWMNGVASDGSVSNLNLTLGNINASAFGAVSGSVQLDSLTVGNIGSSGSIATTVNNFTVDKIVTTGNVEGSIFDTISGTVTLSKGLTINGNVTSANGAIGTVSGTLNCSNITVNGDISGKLIGSINASTDKTLSITAATVSSTGTVIGTVAADSDIAFSLSNTEKALDGVIVGTVDGKKLNLCNLNLGDLGTNARLVNEVKGSAELNLGAITVGDVAGSLVNTISAGAVNADSITTNDVSGSLFGTVSGDVTVGGINAAAVTKPLITSLNSGTVTTGNITMTSRSQPLVGTFAGGTLQGAAPAEDTLNQAALMVNDGNDSIAAVLFAGDVDGMVRNYSIASAGLNANLVANLDGFMTDVTVNVTGDASANVVAKLNGELSGTAIGVAGKMTASAIGTTGSGAVLSGVSVTTGSADFTNSESAIGGVLVAANKTSITDCSVTAGTVAVKASGNFGVIADQIPSGETLSGTNAMVNTLNITLSGDANVGGLVGTNNGAISGSALTNKDGGNAQVNLTGADDTTLVFGGLAGINTGVKTDSVNAGITSNGKTMLNVAYTQTASDKAIIGGLVGANSGTITGTGSTTATDVSGIINLVAIDASGEINQTGTGADRVYVIGGAVGKMTGGTVSNVYVNVSVDTDWMNAQKTDTVSGNTFNVTSEDKGPVGMFVGYASTGTFTSCYNNHKNNDTYQFIGQAGVAKNALSNTWASLGDVDQKTVYGDSFNTEDNTYTVDGFTVYPAEFYLSVVPAFNGCYFYYQNETTIKEQMVGYDEYFYSVSEHSGSVFSAGSAFTGKFDPYTLSVNSSQSYSDKNYYYNIPNTDQYGKITRIVYSEERELFWYRYKATLYYMDETNTETSIDPKEDTGFRKKTFTFDIYTLNSELTANGKYFLSTGNMTVGENGSIELPSEFKPYEEIYKNVFTYNGSQLTATSSYDVAAVLSNFYSVKEPELKFTAGTFKYGDVTEFSLLPVTENGKTYLEYTFNHLDDVKYERQYVTYK